MYSIVTCRNWYPRIPTRWTVEIWMAATPPLSTLPRDTTEWWWWSIYYSMGPTSTPRTRGESPIAHLTVCTVYLSVDLLWVVCCFLGCLDREVILYNIILFSGLVPLHNACSYGHFEVTELLIKVFIFSIMFEEYKMYGTNAMYVVIQVWEYYHCHLMSFSAWCLCKCGRSLEVYPITWSCCQREIWNL